MESFRIDGDAGRTYEIRVTEAESVTDELVRTLIDIDLQTFSESTFSHYTAAAFLRNGRVYLLEADSVVIGSCVVMRCWERPSEVMILSMGIRPGWRGRGLGQRFLGGVLAQLTRRGFRAISLMVGADNRRAIKVYHDVGFVVIENTLEDSRTGETFLLMRHQLIEELLTAVP
jgi:ribosomal protein S18 acetylase RimI-like enzyme